MDSLAAGHDAAVQMIDTSVVRVHQHGARIADNNHQDMGRSRGGLTGKIHAVVDNYGQPAEGEGISIGVYGELDGLSKSAIGFEGYKIPGETELTDRVSVRSDCAATCCCHAKMF